MSWIKALHVTFFLFVVSTLISQSAMDGFAVLSILIFIVIWASQKRAFPLFPKLGLEVPFVAFSAAVVLSFFFNRSTQTLAVPRIIELKWLLNFYLLVAILRYVNPEWSSFQKTQIFIWLSSLFALVTPVIGYDPLRGPEALIDRTPSGVARAGGFFSNPMTFSHLHALVFFLVLGVGFFLWKDKDHRFFSVFLLAFVLCLSILFSFTRGVWMGMIMGLVAMGFMVNRQWGWRTLAVILILGLGAFLAVPSIQERTLQFFSPGGYDGERIWIWKANWRIFLDHPVFGIGYGENTLALKAYYAKVGAPEGLLIAHAHNQFLNILAGTGLVGLSAYIWLLSRILWKTWTTFRRSVLESFPSWHKGLLIGSLGAQVSFLIGGLTESNFEHAKVRYVLMIVWAIPFWLDSIKSEGLKFEHE